MYFLLNLIFLLLSAKPVLLNLWNTPVYEKFDKSIQRHEFFSPYVIGDDIMQGSSDGMLAFINAQTGSIYRRTSQMGGFEKTPSFKRGIFYFTTNDGKAFAYSYRANTTLWSYEVGFPINSTPDVCKNIVVFAASNNSVYALDSKTGKELWVKKRDFPVKTPVIRGSASPICNGSIVYSGFSDGYFLAMNIYDGKTIYEVKLSSDTSKFKDVDAVPVFYLNNIIIPSYDGALYSISSSTGSINWKLPSGSVKDPLLDGDTLYYSSNDGDFFSVNVNEGEIKWKVPLHKGGIGTKPVIYNEYLIIGNSDRGIQIYSKTDGKFLNEFNSGTGVFSDPVIYNDKVLFYSNYAILYAFKIVEKK